MMHRGERLCNPMNLRQSADTFKGEVVPSSDAAFKEFQTVAFGIRAGCVVLINYQVKRQLSTIFQIINRWAPCSENDTGAYIRAMCSRLDVGPMDAFDLTDSTNLGRVAKAIIIQEQGRCLALQVDIAHGVLMAMQSAGLPVT